MAAGGWVGAAACCHAPQKGKIGWGQFCLFEESLLLLLA